MSFPLHVFLLSWFMASSLLLPDSNGQFMLGPQPWHTSDPSWTGAAQWPQPPPPCGPPALLTLRMDCCCCCPPPQPFQPPTQQPPLVPSPNDVGRQPSQFEARNNQMAFPTQQQPFNGQGFGLSSPPFGAGSPLLQSGQLPGSPTAGYWPSSSMSEGGPNQQSGADQIGYLPNYSGDKFTNPGRIQETRTLNAPFFDRIGGEPSYPGGANVPTPAQMGMGPSLSMPAGGRRRRRSSGKNRMNNNAIF